jgi:protocatechuate 3,4-dioxygenase beta subunit
MDTMPRILSRRWFLGGIAGSAAAFAARGAFAQQLSETPSTNEGPFYPDRMPLDTDNDLLIVNDAITPAVGEITHLSGRVLTASGEPLRNAFVEIWEVDNTGSYIHTGGRQPGGNDRNFQGYGRFLTDSKGQYYFRTIKPIEYTLQGMFRAPHIHMAISRSGRRIFTTQILVKGHPANARDSIRFAAGGADKLMVDFQPLPGSKIGELTANFDVVLRNAEGSTEEIRGVGRSQNQRR